MVVVSMRNAGLKSERASGLGYDVLVGTVEEGDESAAGIEAESAELGESG